MGWEFYIVLWERAVYACISVLHTRLRTRYISEYPSKILRLLDSRHWQRSTKPISPADGARISWHNRKRSPSIKLSFVHSNPSCVRCCERHGIHNCIVFWTTSSEMWLRVWRIGKWCSTYHRLRAICISQISARCTVCHGTLSCFTANKDVYAWFCCSLKPEWLLPLHVANFPTLRTFCFQLKHVVVHIIFNLTNIYNTQFSIYWRNCIPVRLHLMPEHHCKVYMNTLYYNCVRWR